MNGYQCPGQDKRTWKPKDVFEASCPFCGTAIEFWKDDPRRECSVCGKTVTNPKLDLGCAKWCKYASACLGATVTEEDQSVCELLIAEMKKVYGNDQPRIDHALQVLVAAEEILATAGGDPLVVKAAAILHDIGIPEAERKHDSSDAAYQEIEGPPIARAILEKLGVSEERTDHVCRIIAEHHSAKTMTTNEFNIIWDADHLINMRPRTVGQQRPLEPSVIDRVFRTQAGRILAAIMLGNKGAGSSSVS